MKKTKPAEGGFDLGKVRGIKEIRVKIAKIRAKLDDAALEAIDRRVRALDAKTYRAPIGATREGSDFIYKEIVRAIVREEMDRANARFKQVHVGDSTYERA